MKRIIRHYAYTTFALFATSKIASGIAFDNGIQTLFITGAALMAALIFAKPVINILLLPLNLVTFGLFRWVASAAVLYIVTLVVKDFKITHFNFGGFSSKWLDVPTLNFSGIIAYIAFAFIFSIILSLIFWLRK